MGGQQCHFDTYGQRNKDLGLSYQELQMLGSSIATVLRGAHQENCLCNQTANLTDKYIRPKCTVECVAKLRVGMLYVTGRVRITISNLSTSFTGESCEFSLINPAQSHSWLYACCGPRTFNAFHVHVWIPGMPQLAQHLASCLHSADIHKGTLYHHFKDYTHFHVFLMRPLKISKIKQQPVRVLST